MENYIENLDKKDLELTKAVAAECAKHSMPCYLVGGIVRDLILGIQNKDLDIVIEGDALKIAKALEKKLKGKATLYPEFLTATLDLASGQRLDLATARSETYESPGALPKVKAGLLKDDLQRRDVSINALAMSLSKDHRGQIIDYFGGLEDLRLKSVRILHEKSFLDDPTRILRVIRFETRFGFRIEAKTLKLLKEAMAKNYVDSVKPPRLYAEFNKMLKEDGVLKALKRLWNLGNLSFLLNSSKPSWHLLSGVEKSALKEKKGKNFKNIEKLWLYYLAALCENLSHAVCDAKLSFFQMPNEEIDIVLQCLDRKEYLRDLASAKLTPAEIYDVLNNVKDDTALYLYLSADSKQSADRILKYLTIYKDTKLSIDGDDVKALGVKSGKKVGDLLRAVLHHKLNKKKLTKTDEITYLKKMLLAK